MTSRKLETLRDKCLGVGIKLELALVRIGIASVPIDMLLSCDDVFYAALALSS